MFLVSISDTRILYMTYIYIQYNQALIILLRLLILLYMFCTSCFVTKTEVHVMAYLDLVVPLFVSVSVSLLQHPLILMHGHQVSKESTNIH